MGTAGLIFGGCLLLCGLLVLISIIRGFVLTYLWTWFMVPFGLPEIGILWAIGISLIISFLTTEGAYQGPPEETKGRLAGHLISPFVILIMGYIIHNLM